MVPALWSVLVTLHVERVWEALVASNIDFVVEEMSLTAKGFGLKSKQPKRCMKQGSYCL